jgi:hypothetical protein
MLTRNSLWFTRKHNIITYPFSRSLFELGSPFGGLDDNLELPLLIEPLILSGKVRFAIRDPEEAEPLEEAWLQFPIAFPAVACAALGDWLERNAFFTSPAPTDGLCRWEGELSARGP